MAVRRQGNWLGQMRVDVPHLRAMESAVAGDFDDLAGKILAGSAPLIASGMTIPTSVAIGGLATDLVLNVADSMLLHGSSTEAGAIYVVPAGQAAEQLIGSNPHVAGTFTPNTMNYVGLDLVRSTDPSTQDTVKFRSAVTRREFSKTAPLARTLLYSINISTVDFDHQTNIAPVAKIQVDADGKVVSITDCRRLMWRLGEGGTNPTPRNIATFDRRENPSVTDGTNPSNDPFFGGDKGFRSLRDVLRGITTRLWELGGGEYWYTSANDRDVRLVYDNALVFSGGENFEWVGSNLHWKGLSVVFGNSTGWKNAITDVTANAAGTTDLADGECLYVDIDRSQNATLTAYKAALGSLGLPTVPGSRYVIAWRFGTSVYTRDAQYRVGAAFATTTYVDTQDALKADRTYVDTQDALKADRTYVDTQDALKMPLAGGTFTGAPSYAADPAGPNVLTRRQYVDDAVAGANSSSALAAHINDTTAAHAASAIGNTPAGGVSATTVQAAINELDSEKATTAYVDGFSNTVIGSDSASVSVDSGTGPLVVSTVSIDTHGRPVHLSLQPVATVGADITTVNVNIANLVIVIITRDGTELYRTSISPGLFLPPGIITFTDTTASQGPHTYAMTAQTGSATSATFWRMTLVASER